MTEPTPEDVAPAPRSAVLCAPWASPADVPEVHRGLLSDAEWARKLMLASEILWALSGRRFYGGGCAESVTLRSSPPAPGEQAWPYSPTWGDCPCWTAATVYNGLLIPMPHLWQEDHYSAMAIRLPRAPVSNVVVQIDGVPFAGWRMTRAGYLERTDGKHWRMCDDSTTVSYEFGEAPPEGGVAAVVELAVQLAKDELGTDDCQLPRRISSITRQGVSIAVVDEQEFLDQGRVGLYLTDLWLRAVNPGGRGQRARVWSPDIPTAVRN